MDDQPDLGTETISPQSQPPCPGPPASACRRRFASFKGPVAGAVLGAALFAGLHYGAAVVYLGILEGCWG
jgi:hypothetical protein